jgi:hypothetical protein
LILNIVSNALRTYRNATRRSNAFSLFLAFRKFIFVAGDFDHLRAKTLAFWSLTR